MSDSLNLYRLQQLDTRLAQIDARLKVIFDSLEKNVFLSDAKANLIKAQDKLKSSENSVTKLERDAQDKKIKIEQIESKLYSGGLQNPKELQELQQELALFKRQFSALEDQELEEMIALEKAQAELKNNLENHEQIRSQVELQNSHLVRERDNLKKESDRLNTERQATVQSINEKSLALYNEIREERHGIAVTTISENSCDSCGSVITPSQKQSSHHSHQLFRCPSCGRIIYS
jgi:uncharacterized protein